MMAVIETWYNQDLQQPVKVHHLDGSMFSHNGNGNRIGVHVFNNGEPVTLSGTVSGYVITSDGSTVPCVGAMSGNEATITIPPAAYQPGSAFITIFLTEGSTATTICAAQTTVLQARTGSQVSPGSVVTDWTQTINAAMQSVEDAAENIGGIIATPYPSLTYPVPLGKYTYYNNNLYRCISPIAESEEFTAAHWKQVRLGDDVADLNSALDDNGIGNSFNGELYNGYWNAEGVLISYVGDVCNASMIPCPENASIRLVANTTAVNPAYFIYYFDQNNTRFSRISGTGTEFTGTAPTGTVNMGFCFEQSGLTKDSFASVGVYINNALTQMEQSISELDANLDDCLSAIDNKIDLSGENQVTPQNIEGMRFTKTAQEVAGKNIFSELYLGENDYYANVDSAVTPPKIAHANVSGYRWYAIPVDGVSKYTFTEARFACLAKGNTIGSEAIGATLAYASEVTTTGASYLILSYSSSVTNIEVRKIDVGYIYSDFILPDWMIHHDTKPKYVSTTGNLSDGTFLALLGYKQNLRKGERYVFTGNITEFSAIKFGFTYANAFSASTILYNEFTIDSTHVTYKTTSTNENYTYQYAHGLTFANNIQFIFEYLDEGNAKITLISNGVSFTQTLSFVKQIISQVVALSVGSTLTGCKLSWIPIDIDKDIWMFGDSYFAYSSARWTYYLQQYGYAQNALIDGWPGEGSVNARNSLLTFIQFGTPKYIVWCMGMNDGSDTDASTPNSNWTVRRDEMLAICNENGITPIFATIPNVPSILHTGKNAWIKSSGYRYIDFAAAVGAETAGSYWYNWGNDTATPSADSLLSSDKVHPTERGAKALFARALVDFPEIMLDD